MRIGYARISTADQHALLDAQLGALAGDGCERCFSEQVSSQGQRHQLAAALATVGGGDVLVVTAPDRLARSTEELLTLVSRLTGQGTGFVALSAGGKRLDTETEAGTELMAAFAAVAAFERTLASEWRREADAKKAAPGGRAARTPPARRRADDVLGMLSMGLRPVDVAHRLGIGTASVYRIMAGAKELMP